MLKGGFSREVSLYCFSTSCDKLCRHFKMTGRHTLRGNFHKITADDTGVFGAATSSRYHASVQLRRGVRRTLSLHANLIQERLHQAQAPRPQHPKRYLRTYARLTLICIRLCKLSLQSLEEESGEFLSVLQVMDRYGSSIDRQGLFFDPEDFRANTQEHLTQEARRVLATDPAVRTERQIGYLLIVLRNIPAFAEYPKRMQKKLCKVGWYERYEPRRAIIREGHPPHSFYFILSGSVLVTVFEAGTTRTLVILDRGMSFGELAVITRSRRQATVSTKTTVELLCISAWDFEDIFMAGGMKTVTDPDHNSFLRSVRFLKHWPIQELAQHSQTCMFHYFNRGQVLVRDSNNSDWIYIVKSGSLSVLKKLHRVQAHNSDRPDEEDEEEIHTSRSENRAAFGTWNYRLPHHASRRKKNMRRSLSPEVFKNQVEADRRLEQSLPGLNNTSERLGVVDYDRVVSEYRARVLPKPSEPLRLPKISHRGLISAPEQLSEPLEGAMNGTSHPENGQEEEEEEETGEEESSEGLGEQRAVSKTSKGVYLAPSPVRRRKKSRKVKTHDGSSPTRDTEVPETKDEEEQGEEEGEESTETNSLSTESVTAELKRINIDYQRRFRERVGRKTMAEALDFKGARDFRYSEVDLDPMFVLVQILERGQYFGVSQILYPEQPSTCLVSNGAECIVLSKRLFLDLANEACMRHIRETECPYPPEDVLQNRLQDYVNWEAHRARVYKRLVTDIRQRKVRRKQFLPHLPGQYCFRSGTL